MSVLTPERSEQELETAIEKNVVQGSAAQLDQEF